MGYQDLPERYIYLNTRGIEISGVVGKKIGFYTFFADNQMIPTFYQDEYIKNGTTIPTVPIIPNEAFGKTFKTRGYDFITARGYLTIPITKNHYSSTRARRIYLCYNP